MFLQNNGDEFNMVFNGTDVLVKSGVFEVGNDLGSFITNKAKKWGKDIKIIDTKPSIEDSSEIRLEEPVIEHIITEEDLVNNDGLEEQGVAVGDTIQLPVTEIENIPEIEEVLAELPKKKRGRPATKNIE